MMLPARAHGRCRRGRVEPSAGSSKDVARSWRGCGSWGAKSRCRWQMWDPVGWGRATRAWASPYCLLRQPVPDLATPPFGGARLSPRTCNARSSLHACGRRARKGLSGKRFLPIIDEKSKYQHQGGLATLRLTFLVLLQTAHTVISTDAGGQLRSVYVRTSFALRLERCVGRPPGLEDASRHHAARQQPRVPRLVLM